MARHPRQRNDQPTAQAAEYAASPHLPPKRIEELNTSVVRRYYPSVVSVLLAATYATVYDFSAEKAQWEKIGIEGAMFVCKETPDEIGSDRFCVVVLNRRGIENYRIELLEGDRVDITEECTIINNGDRATALWIFTEPPPSSTIERKDQITRLIKYCSIQAGNSRKEHEARFRAARVPVDESGQVIGAEPMVRQPSLRAWFGKQRAEDDEWSVKSHSPRVEPAQFARPFPTQLQQERGQEQEQHFSNQYPSINAGSSYPTQNRVPQGGFQMQMQQELHQLPPNQSQPQNYGGNILGLFQKAQFNYENKQAYGPTYGH